MLFTKLAVRLGESGERFSSFCQSSISYFPAFVKRLLQFLSDFFARPVLFFEKKSRQKKLQLSGTICIFFRLPCVKGAPPKAVRDCFFTTRLGDACKCASHTRKSLQPLRGFRTPLGEACKHAPHTCKSLYTREPEKSAQTPR